MPNSVSKSTSTRARIATVALVALLGFAASPVNAHVSGSAGTLPAGTSLSVGIASPADGSLFIIPSGLSAIDVPFAGAAAIGEGAPIQDTTVVFVVDASGSMLGTANVDCTGDGAVDTREVCAKAAVVEVNTQAIGPPTSVVDQTGVASFSSASTAWDVDLSAASSHLVAPAHDGDADGQFDVHEVVDGLPVGGSTCYACGVSAADAILAASANAVNLVVFLSDGENNVGTHAASIATANFGANTIVHAFAMGSFNCDSDPFGFGTLDDVVALSTGGPGSCTKVTDFSQLSGFISAAIGSTLADVETSFQGGAYASLGSLDVAVPASGPATASWAETLAGLTAGTYEVCARASGADAGGPGSATDCHTFSVANSPDCSAAGPSVGVLWPPNNKMVPVGVVGVTHPDGLAFGVAIDAIWQDESVDTTGDGKFVPDGAGLGTAVAGLRAERAGTASVPGDGRAYHVSFTATDVNGGACSGTVVVGVPFSMAGGGIWVDGGALYDSTIL